MVVSLSKYRNFKAEHETDIIYQSKINKMDKLALLEEMVRFQEERVKQGILTLKMMIQGKILFKALEESAETNELRLLTRSYRRHLDYELAEYLKHGKT